MTHQAVFRCDASPAIGGGHVMRCLALANALAEAGWQSTFATCASSTGVLPAISQSGHEIRVVNVAASQAAQADEIAAWYPDGIALLVADHYGLSAGFEHAGRSWAKEILVIDELADREHDCDMLLAPVPGCRPEDYRGRVPDECRYLTGAEYALLRPQFARARQTARSRRSDRHDAGRILVSFGAADGRRMTPRVLSALADAGYRAPVTVIVGASAESASVLTEMAPRLPYPISVLHDVDDMAAQMTAADIAIMAAGSSLLEAASLGLPVVAVVTADNQQRQGAAIHEAGAIRLAGDWNSLDLPALADMALGLLRDPSTLQCMSENGMRLCNGRGASRAALAISPPRDNAGNGIGLRPASFNDAELMFRWQTTPGARKWMRNSAAPSYAEHMAWWQRRLQMIDLDLYIVEAPKPVGYVRVDGMADGRHEVSIMIDPDHAGRGVGTAALRALRRLLPELPLHAEIRPGNLASASIFAKAGYRQDGGNGWYRSDPIAAGSGDARTTP
ncbi:UDP-2,4-diacetamido-2,4,6-trideoxy-beta-L-altropyranose hydrolase [Ferrovibrio sp.]|uniref:UDP-2,4-diacetamido-2,4, 6-trideoxy-beta-L-altropyranose hydrolase n=1 Tax=Ferrovibrio sp. TaxID=1917215 RepID=UPI000CC814DE|nr:UDP-2,4-diacetamido-2,4,6-trideoxy-beta-L-altropyranose hydrolase [Ferrovibrio sp.]PJI41897.1 MAG: UDP-2,4-diacetamido-2,4,6-trideoxy-beta-L-altropyranose hydrolase [Ferrovibrio sp.]